MKKIIEIYKVLKDEDLLVSQIQEGFENIEVEDITYDSREVCQGTLFFCKGKAFKRDYLINSIADGACAYVSEEDYHVEIPAIIVKDIRKAMISVAAFFFDYPDEKIKIIGVTGTKGKTTTVKYLKAIFDEYLTKNGKKPCGLVSSVNVYDGVSDNSATLTTPEAIPLYKHINNAVNSGLEYLVLEVSSQALKYHRVTKIKFDLSCFLNIGDDHVSAIEHPTFEDYFNSKLSLAKQSDYFIYNSQMDNVEQVQARVKELNIGYMTFSLDNQRDDIYALNIDHKVQGTTFQANYHGKAREFTLKMPGDYNVENALCAILVAYKMGLDYQSIRDGLSEVVVEGRDIILESDDKKIIAWINYAHNGISFQKSYETIKGSYGDYRIISVYGGSGDKAHTRLVDVSSIGAKYSDYIVIVPDDPGSKPYDQIISEMRVYIEAENVPFEYFEDRAEGIQRAFDLVEGEKTLIFIAGKGSDAYNVINGQYVDIEDDVTSTNRIMAAYNKKNKY